MYEILLKAHYILPDVQVSSEKIDFGKVIIGQKKTITISVRNKKPVPVEWTYRAPKGSYGKAMAPWETIYNIEPDYGLLNPGDIQWIKISFTPNNAQNFNQKLSLKIKDNPHRKVLGMTGVGMQTKLTTSVDDIALAPCLPYYDRAIRAFYIENPMEFPITVYCSDFDNTYK